MICSFMQGDQELISVIRRLNTFHGNTNVLKMMVKICMMWEYNKYIPVHWYQTLSHWV